ncbi:MAG TPA: hypothetical protein VM658_15845 [bacterium]|nr:hypothetical protein [bacterium]
MKCPRCGLIHAPLDQVCRRCEIDLRTGEPRMRSAEPIATRLNAPSSLKRLRERIKSPRPGRPAPVPGAPSTEAAPPPHHGHPAKEQHAPARTKPAAFVAYAMSKRPGISGVLSRLGRGPAVKSINCVQCNAEMDITRTAPFSRSGPIALIVLGAGLLIAGIFFRLLIITGAAAAALAVIYLRVGRTSWKCPTCGFTIPRAP